jgi:hypothetical protein
MMATWTDIPDTSIEPGRAIRSIDGRALRDNVVALAEGASGAPRISNSALDGGITNNKLAGGITWNKIASVSAGNVINAVDARGYSKTSTVGSPSYSAIATPMRGFQPAFNSISSGFLIHRAGTVRIRFRYARPSGDGSAGFRLYRQRPSGTDITTNDTLWASNSTSINTVTSSSASLATNTVDVAVAEGDILYISFNGTADSTGIEMRSLVLMSSTSGFVASLITASRGE